ALRAVDGISLGVREGERRAIIGPNGAGKTTLFNAIAGEVPVSGGSVRFAGQSLDMRKFSMLGAPTPKGAEAERIDATLTTSGLSARRRDPTRTLSYGEQRQLEFA